MNDVLTASGHVGFTSEGDEIRLLCDLTLLAKHEIRSAVA
jgi:hypothetical protein